MKFSMKKIFYIGIAIAVSGIFASCDDFLDQKPQSVGAAVNFYKNDNDIEEAVNACYANLQKSQLYRDFMVTMAETRSDNVEDQNPGGNAGRDYNIDRFTAGADNACITAVWQYHYHTIMRCNAVLDNINVCIDPQRKLQYEGEARFVRALMYFNLVRFWGAVPIVDHQITVDEAIAAVRNDVSDVYRFIEEDLKFASTNLPKTYDSNNVGRATSGAALCLLGKVYLTLHRWQDCVDTLKPLVSTEYSAVYQLQSSVVDLFKMDNAMNKEMMFVVRFSKTIVGEGRAFNQYYKNASLLDINLRNGYEAADVRKSLIETKNLDKDNTPFLKFYDTLDETTGNVGYDQPILRYADVYLMYVEALNEIAYDPSPRGDAFYYLNLLRTRAKATSYNASRLTDQDSFREAVLWERRLEFPLELHRWFDLLRTGTAIEAMKKVGINIKEDDLLYPIPKTELDLCPNLYQNPGYELK